MTTLQDIIEKAAVSPARSTEGCTPRQASPSVGAGFKTLDGAETGTIGLDRPEKSRSTVRTGEPNLVALQRSSSPASCLSAPSNEFSFDVAGCFDNDIDPSIPLVCECRQAFPNLSDEQIKQVVDMFCGGPDEIGDVNSVETDWQYVQPMAREDRGPAGRGSL